MKDAMISITAKPSAGFFVRRLAVLSFIFLPGLVSAQEIRGIDTVTLSEVEVYAKKVSIYPIEPIVIKDFNFQPVHDLGDFLRQEPNVSGIRKGGIAIDPVVRGFKYNQVSVLLNNGVKVEGGCPNRMDPVVSHVETENISKVELVKGPYVLKYGPVMGALINVQTTQPESYTHPAIHGKVLFGFESNWNGQREHIELSGGNKDVYFRASAGYKGYGSYTAGNGELFNTSFRKSYATLDAGFRIKGNHRFMINYIYDQGNNVQFPALPMDEQLDRTNITSLNYEALNLGKVFNSLQVQGYFSSVHHVMDNYNRPSAQSMQAITTVDAWNTGGKVVGSWKAGDKTILTGLDFEHIYKDGQKQMTMKMVMAGDTFTSVRFTNVFNRAVWNNAGLFSEFQSRFGTVDFTAALRLDYNQANSADTFKLVKDGVAWFDKLNSSFLNISFNTGIKKRLVQEFYLTASLGLGTRSPSILERYIKLMPVNFDSYDYLGNPQLKPEQNYQADLGLDYYLPGLGSFTANGFFSLVHDYILGKIIPPSVIKPSTQGVLGVKQFSNVDLVWLTGFEFSFQSPSQKKWGIMATAAATFGTNPAAVKYLTASGQVTGEETVNNDPLPEIPPLEGSVQFLYKFLKQKLVPKVIIRLVNAQNRVSEAYGEQTTPGFVTAAFSLSYIPCQFFSVSAGVENILNNPYYEHLNRRIVGSTEKLYEPGRVLYINLMMQF